MKKMISLVIAVLMLAGLCTKVVAIEETDEESFADEELLAMDPELDSDGDGIADVIEIVYEFDRFDPDSDDDGVSDYVEFCITCTDVLTPDGDIDTDGDGLTNAEEGALGTNPDDLDSDNDDLNDYYEVKTLHTDPNAKDTDGDGVQDGVEVEQGSNPLMAGLNSMASGSQELSDDSKEECAVIAPLPEIFDDPSGGGFNATLHTEYDGAGYDSRPQKILCNRQDVTV